MTLWICRECQDGTDCIISKNLPPKECVISTNVGDAVFHQLDIEDHVLKLEAVERGFLVIDENKLIEAVRKVTGAAEELGYMVDVAAGRRP